MLYWVLSRLAKVISYIWFRMKLTGKEYVPRVGRGILVCNHFSLVDVFIAVSVSPRQVYFMGKKELFENPFMNWLMHGVGAFPISRGEADLSGIRKALALLKEEKLLFVFPEGTRNKRPQEVALQPLQEGVAMLAIKGQAPVIPMYVRGRYNPITGIRAAVGPAVDLGPEGQARRPDNAALKACTQRIAQAMLACRARTQPPAS